METDNRNASLLSPLIQNSGQDGLNVDNDIAQNKRRVVERTEILEEVKKQLWLAGPLVFVSLLNFCIQVISVMFVGHLGELALSGASMAISFSSVTGISLLMGMASALDTLCGQSYGTKQHRMLGIHMQRALLILIFVSIPLAIIWANTGSILIFIFEILFTILLAKRSHTLDIIIIFHQPDFGLFSLNKSSTVWMIPFGVSGAVSIRVSNELGAGHPWAALLAVYVVLVIDIVEGTIIGTVMILIRNVWGYAYSNEVEVVEYVAIMLPILAASSFLEGLECVLPGTARGCGWQKIGAFINLGSYYIVGIPSAILLAFTLHLGGKGLWMGIICALVVQVLSLFIITIRTGWEQEENKATDRVYDSIIPKNIVS